MLATRLGAEPDGAAHSTPVEPDARPDARLDVRPDARPTDAARKRRSKVGLALSAPALAPAGTNPQTLCVQARSKGAAPTPPASSPPEPGPGPAPGPASPGASACQRRRDFV